MLTALIAAAIFAQAAPAAGPSPDDSRVVAAGSSGSNAAPGGKTVSPLLIAPVAKPSASDIQKYTMVCHNETVLGSMFPKKVCASQAQSTERRDIDQAAVRQMEVIKR